MLPMLNSGSIYLNNKHLTDELPEITFPDNDIPDYVKSFSLTKPAYAEFEVEAEINVPLLHKIAGIDLAAPGAQSFIAEYSEPYQEQRRKHKKKRINKKWAKRYGYVTKFRKWRIKEVSLMSNGLEFEATGKNVELVK